MTRFLICLWAVIGFFSLLHAQTNGLPQDYFQQEVNYTIRVTLDDRNHYLRGSEEFTYKNNSPTVLQEIYIHLYPNAYLDRSTAFAKQKVDGGSTEFYYSPKEDRGFIDSLDFRINGTKVGIKYVDGNWDIARLTLPQPLQPGQSITVTTPFRVQIPASFSRMGHVEQQYQITQWYPKPAVFDRKGWHPMPYLDQGEFYAEFGTYDVYITLPKNYVVGATGELQNGEAELNWMKKRAELSNQMLRQEEQETNTVFKEEFSPKEMKTLHFRQDRVHDFAWFCDKQYYVQMSEATLPNSSRKVKTIALFNERHKNNWKKATTYINEAVYHYSLYVGEYPFNVCTAVDGALSAGAGMEYPTITVVSAGGNDESLKQVIVHEVGHNWFQGILASNERIHPWQDEGMNSYIEGRSLQAIAEKENRLKNGGKTSIKKNGKGITISTAQALDWGFKYAESFNNDQAIDGTSEEYTDWNYGIIVYAKTAMAFRNLQSYLGTERFDKCMHAYFDRWKFKHPYPEDLQAVFEENAGENLGWFFQEYFQSHEPIEFVARNAQIKGKSLQITIDNQSQRTLPAFLVLKDHDYLPIDTIWTPPFIGTETFTLNLKKQTNFKYVEVNSGQKFPEMNPNNNVLKYRPATTDFQRKCATPRLGLIWRPDDARYRYLLVSPAVGYNTRDGWMLGGGVYYQPFPKRHLEFHALPMYGFKSDRAVGSMDITYRIFTEGRLKKIELKSRTALFADFLHSKNFIEFHVQPRRMRNKLTYIYSLNSYHIATRSATKCSDYTFQNDYRPYYVSANVHYLMDKTTFRYGFDAEVGAHSTDAVRAFIAPKLVFNYTKKGEVHLRMFAGRFMSGKNVPVPLRWGLSGSFDPFGEHVMLDRPMFYADRPQQSEWLNRQVIEDQGFFKTLTGVTSSKWLVSFNGAISLPNTRNIRLFGNLGLVPYDPIASSAFANPIWRNNNDVQTFYDAGVSFHFFKQTLNIYLPLAGSVFQKDTPKTFKEFHQNITFSLKINDVIRKYLN